MGETIRQCLNLEFNAMLAELDTAIDRIPPQDRVFRVRCAAAAHENEWSNVLCLVDACGRIGTNAETREYSGLILARQQLDEDELRSLVESISMGVIPLGGATVQVSKPGPLWSREYIHSQSEFSPHPGTLLETQPNSQPAYRHAFNEPLLSYTLPFEPDSWSAISRWIGLPNVGQHPRVNLGSSLIFIPERRARIQGLKRAGNILRVAVEFADTRPRGLALRGAWWTDREFPSPIEARVQGAEVEVQIPAEWDRVQLYLIDSNDQVLDYYRQSPHFVGSGHGPIPRFDIDRIGAVETMRQIVRGGEGVQVELKPYIDLSQKKADEIVRTVIAFANTEGGRILIGVNDDLSLAGEPIHYGRAARDLKSSESNALKRYAGAVLARIKDNVAPDIAVEVDSVEVDGHMITVIDVPRTEHVPCYAVDSKRMWVRRGSNNAPADPETDIPAIYARKMGFAHDAGLDRLPG